MFPCTGCGLCCQSLSNIDELKDFDLGDGCCKYFDTKTNSCKIYETRPNICRIDKMFDVEYHKFYSKKEFYILNADACNNMQRVYKLDKSFKVKIGE